MQAPQHPQTTLLLHQLARGDRSVADELLSLVYDDCRALAAGYLRHESPDHILQPTALAHEAYLRLIDQTRVDWQGRTHFLAVAAQAMRRILVDAARHRDRLKRGGGWNRITMEAVAPSGAQDNAVDLLALEEALQKLTTLHERQAKIVEMRFFAGMTMEQIAEAMGLSKRTVEGDWSMARAWLQRELSGDRLLPQEAEDRLSDELSGESDDPGDS